MHNEKSEYVFSVSALHKTTKYEHFICVSSFFFGAIWILLIWIFRWKTKAVEKMPGWELKIEQKKRKIFIKYANFQAALSIHFSCVCSLSLSTVCVSLFCFRPHLDEKTKFGVKSNFEKWKKSRCLLIQLEFLIQRVPFSSVISAPAVLPASFVVFSK